MTAFSSAVKHSLKVVPLLTALVVLSTSYARASIIDYDFTFSSGSTPAGTFGGPSPGTYSGVFEVNDVTGEIAGITGSGTEIGSITALVAPGGYSNNDNKFSQTPPYLDSAGISFSTSLFSHIQLLETSNNEYVTAASGLTAYYGRLTVTPSVEVPEPASLTTMVLALLGLCVARRGAARQIWTATAVQS